MSRGTSHRATRPAGERRADVVAWRRRRLERAGFGPGVADSFAADGRVDLHSLLDLVDRGCPPHLAARIVAPIDAPAPEDR